MKVVVGGVGDRLPARFRAYQDDAAFPDLIPGAPVLVAQPLKAALGGRTHHPGRLAIRLVGHLTGAKTRELVQDVGPERRARASPPVSGKRLGGSPQEKS